MRIFHGQLLFELATENYSIHRATKNNVPKIMAFLLHLGRAHLKRLAYLVSLFACNTRVIVDVSSSPPVSLMSNSCNKT